MKNGGKGAAEKIVAAVTEGFSAEKLIEDFDVLAEAAGGIKRLKELILDLAVRGALTSNESGEGTADQLIASIHRSRRDLSSRGIRIRGDLGEVAPEDAPYAVPPGWRWVHLGFLGGFLGGGTPSKSNAGFWKGPIPWVSPKDMKRLYIDDAEDHISSAAVESSAAKLIPASSLLFVVRGMILAHSFPVALTTREVTVNQDMRALVLAFPDVREFVLRACQAARARVLARVERSSHGTCRLDSEVVETLPIALPPLEEQRQIVAKVDQLMAVCDELEARQSKKREVAALLTKSVFEAISIATSATDLDSAWLRASGVFAEVVGSVDAIRHLRGLIIELAICGRLVSKAAADVQVPGLKAAEVAPYPLPEAWQWVRLESIASEIVDCLHSTPKYTAHGVPAVRTADVVPGKILVEQARLIDEEQYIDRVRRLVPVENDIVYSREGERLGIAACVPKAARLCLAQRMMHIRIRPPVYAPFIMWAMNSRFVYSQAVGGTGGSTSPHINMKSIRRFLIPIPPLGQQQRIVHKMEQLLQLCDNLEARLRLAEDRSARFAGAVVRELVT